MGLFKRLHRITIGRIEAFFSRVEDPETLFPVLVKEMEEQLTAATEAEAQAMATLKGCEREISKHEETVQRYENGAFNAVKQGDDETAVEAIKAQITAEKSFALAKQNVETATIALERAHAGRERIQKQLEELKVKKDEILTRARVAKTQKKIQATVSGSLGSGDSILDAVARLEAEVEKNEAELEIQQSLIGEGTASQSLEDKLKELESSSEIEKRLDELKKRASRE